MVEITEIFGFTLVMPLLLPCTLEMSLEFVTVFFQSSYENWVGSTYRLGRKSPLSSPLALSISLELSSYLFPGDSMVDWWISKREWCRAHITLSFPLQLGNSPWNSMLSVFHSCFGDCCNSKLSRKDPLRSPSTLNFPLEIRDFRITDDREESIRLRRSDIFFLFNPMENEFLCDSISMERRAVSWFLIFFFKVSD